MIKTLPLKDLLKSQIYKGELYSFQIITILLALENFSGKNNLGVEIYHKWIKSRKKRDPFQSTINLAILSRSFEMNGFSSNFPLEIDGDDHLLNGGTHRTACSLFYGLDSVPYIFRNRQGQTKDNPKYYGLDYFKSDENFSKKDVEVLLSRWTDIIEKYELRK